jgi:hypothetical protein
MSGRTGAPRLKPGLFENRGAARAQRSRGARRHCTPRARSAGTGAPAAGAHLRTGRVRAVLFARIKTAVERLIRRFDRQSGRVQKGRFTRGMTPLLVRQHGGERVDAASWPSPAVLSLTRLAPHAMCARLACLRKKEDFRVSS